MDSKTVLIVDDAAFMRMILKDILEKHSYKVVGEATNGQDGIYKYSELKPDITIMDIHMAEKTDGIDAVRKIKSLDSNATIIMLSAVGFLPIVLESIQSGASDFIVKPFQAEQLLDIIYKALEKNCYYNSDTITSLLSNIEFKSRCPEHPASQKVINELLKICSGEYTFQSPEVLQFVNGLM